MRETASLRDRDRSVIWHPYSPILAASPLEVIRAEKEFLFLNDGNTLIDLISSWWVNLHGHGHPHIAEQVSNQLRQLDHTIFAGFTHEPAVRLAERLLEHLPPTHERIFYSDNGSTAVEVAIKIAIQYWKERGQSRTLLAVLEGSYHGDTVGAMSVSERGTFTALFHDLLFEVVVLPRPAKDTRQFQDALEDLIAKRKPAAFIYEPLIQGAAGMQMMDGEALNQGLSFCRGSEVLCIADEVMTGFGRTGRWFASDYMTTAPDIICLSKGITGGVMPFGATSCASHVVDQFRNADRTRTFFHGHSYSGNPLACAAALASLDLMERQETWEQIERISASHQKALSRLASFDMISGARSLGTILACEFNARSEGYLSEKGPELYRFFIERGVLIRPLGNTVYLMPPYCISEESLSAGYQAIAAACGDDREWR